MFEDFDPQQLDNMVRGVEGLSRALAQFTDKRRQDEEAMRTSIKRQDEIESSWKKSFVKTKRDYDDTIGTMVTRVEFFSKASMKQLDATERRWKQYGAEVKRQMTEARGAVGSAGEMLGMSGSRGIASSVGGVASSIMGQLPMGGLIGLILYGNKREQEFDAASTRVTRILDQFGQGAETANRVRGRVEAMHREFGSMGDELKAVIVSLQGVGIGKEMFDKVGVSAGAFGRDLAGVLTALEAGNNMQAGSIAKMFAQTFESGAGEREALLQDYLELDRVAQQTGSSVERLMSVMTQSASTLRVQRQGVSDLADAYKQLYQNFRNRGFGEQAAASAAQRGVQAAAGGVGNLSEGLSAELSRRMGGPDGVAGIIAMQEGLVGQGEFAGSVFKELKKLAVEVTGNGSIDEQKYALQKLAPGLGVEGARAIAEMTEGTSLADLRESIKDPQEKLLDAFNRRSKEESPWEKQIRKIMFDLAKLGSALLNITTSGFGVLITLGARALQGAGIDLGVEVGPNDTQDAINQYMTAADEVVKATTKVFGTVVEAGSNSMGVNADVMPAWLKRAKNKKDTTAADNATMYGAIGPAAKGATDNLMTHISGADKRTAAVIASALTDALREQAKDDYKRGKRGRQILGSPSAVNNAMDMLVDKGLVRLENGNYVAVKVVLESVNSGNQAEAD